MFQVQKLQGFIDSDNNQSHKLNYKYNGRFELLITIWRVSN